MPVHEHDARIHLIGTRSIWFFAVTRFRLHLLTRCVTSPASGHLTHILLKWSGRLTLPLLRPYVSDFGLPGPAPDYYDLC